MRISDGSSDVCSADLLEAGLQGAQILEFHRQQELGLRLDFLVFVEAAYHRATEREAFVAIGDATAIIQPVVVHEIATRDHGGRPGIGDLGGDRARDLLALAELFLDSAFSVEKGVVRSEKNTSE